MTVRATLMEGRRCVKSAGGKKSKVANAPKKSGTGKKK